MSTAERARRFRNRQRRGIAVFRIEAPLWQAADALVAAGWLADWDADDRAKIEAALSRAVAHLLADRDA